MLDSWKSKEIGLDGDYSENKPQPHICIHSFCLHQSTELNMWTMNWLINQGIPVVLTYSNKYKGVK